MNQQGMEVRRRTETGELLEELREAGIPLVVVIPSGLRQAKAATAAPTLRRKVEDRIGLPVEKDRRFGFVGCPSDLGLLRSATIRGTFHIVNVQGALDLVLGYLTVECVAPTGRPVVFEIDRISPVGRVGAQIRWFADRYDLFCAYEAWHSEVLRLLGLPTATSQGGYGDKARQQNREASMCRRMNPHGRHCISRISLRGAP